MTKRVLIAATFAILILLVVFDFRLNEHYRAKFLATYSENAPTSVPPDAVQSLRSDLSVCDVKNRGQYTQHQLCWVTIGGPAQAMLQLFGPEPLFFERLTGRRVGERTPDNPGGSPITGIIDLPKPE